MRVGQDGASCMEVYESLAQMRDAAATFGDRLGDIPTVAAGDRPCAAPCQPAGALGRLVRDPPRRIPGAARDAPAAAYLAGAGANAVAPLRGGDLVRIFAIRRELPGVS